MKVMMAMVIVMKVILIVKDVMTRVVIAMVTETAMKVMVTKEMMVMMDVMTRVALMMRHAMEALMKEAETAAVMTDSYSTV